MVIALYLPYKIVTFLYKGEGNYLSNLAFLALYGF